MGARQHDRLGCRRARLGVDGDHLGRATRQQGDVVRARPVGQAGHLRPLLDEVGHGAVEADQRDRVATVEAVHAGRPGDERLPVGRPAEAKARARRVGELTSRPAVGVHDPQADVLIAGEGDTRPIGRPHGVRRRGGVGVEADGRAVRAERLAQRRGRATEREQASEAEGEDAHRKR